MSQFKNIEISHDGRDVFLFIHKMDNGKIFCYTPDMADFTDYCYNVIAERYPEAMKQLLQIYPKGSHYYKYKIVRQFFRCNLFINDHVSDIDENGHWHLELVPCPARGGWCKCEDIICNPKLNTNLSDREIEIGATLIQNNNDKFDAADRMFLSSYTVENHRRNIYAKLQINSFAEMAEYFRVNKLIK